MLSFSTTSSKPNLLISVPKDRLGMPAGVKRDQLQHSNEAAPWNSYFDSHFDEKTTSSAFHLTGVTPISTETHQICHQPSVAEFVHPRIRTGSAGPPCPIDWQVRPSPSGHTFLLLTSPSHCRESVRERSWPVMGSTTSAANTLLVSLFLHLYLGTALDVQFRVD